MEGITDLMIRIIFLLISLLSAGVFLTACWDKVEIDQLALVTMMGVDIDPETGEHKVYYQVVNPFSGATTKGESGAGQAPVYTYEVSGKSYGETRSKAYELMSRRLLLSHFRILIVSERIAKQGLRDIVNYIEVQPNGRSTIPILVADGSVSEIMKTFTVLDRVPAEAYESRLQMLNDFSLLTGDHIHVRDVSERMQRKEMFVLPMIRKNGSGEMDINGRVSTIDANKNNVQILNGAVFREDRMLSRISDMDLVWYHVLTGEKGQHALRFYKNGLKMTAVIEPTYFRQSITFRRGKPVARFDIDLEFSNTLDYEYFPKTREQVERLEKEFTQYAQEKMEDFYNKTKNRGWDLLRIGRSLEKTLSRNGLSNRKDRIEWSDAELELNVHTQFRHAGNINARF